ncbi:hypothetical protein [Opitutus terrae]|uniref:Uncharacterized protein n=1 Tax=Opitutus terrae (strain DSM 11246 / JCM 15787 / PB90-1) TaxID=452637 RepID=B1ZVQ3_OPITP|nr:hypothetical protein [Opitutus terrae]ACB74989.1 hypothetical protein Oter_1705 [Opitutus terrae PB90-1]
MKRIRAGLILTVVLMSTGALAAAAPAGKPAADKTAEEPQIAGVEIPRPNGAFLGLEIVRNNFVLSFYDANKEKVAPDVARATMRWPVKYQPTDERTVLNPGGDGTSLTSPKVVRPPHNFRVFIALFVEGNDSAVETYSVDVRG